MLSPGLGRFGEGKWPGGMSWKLQEGSLPCGSGWACVLCVENTGLDNQATSVDSASRWHSP